MEKSPSALNKWLDSDFFKLGAFISSSDGKTVTFAKGGSFTLVEEFLNTPEAVFYLKDFYQNTYLAYKPKEMLTLARNDIQLSQIEHEHFSPITNDDDLYEKDFHLLQSAFSPALEKVVLVSREEYEPFKGPETILYLLNKALTFGTGIPYGFWNGQYGMIGSTPEVLYEVTGPILKTFALAGTTRLGQEEELLNSVKDRHEHDLVVQDIKEKFEQFSEKIQTGQTHIHKFNSIVHLRTDIQCVMPSDTNYTQLTNMLSPTAALGGYPKETALKFLANSHYGNKYPQRYFGSAFGLITADTKEFIVSIRNVEWEAKHLYIESGGGVVPASVLVKEMDEIHLKRNIIRKHYL